MQSIRYLGDSESRCRRAGSMAQCQKPSSHRHSVPSEALGMFYFLFIAAKVKTVRLLTSPLSSLKMMTEVLPTCNDLHGLKMLPLPKPALKCTCWKPITLNRHPSKHVDNSSRSPCVQKAGKVWHLTLQGGATRLRAAGGNKHPDSQEFPSWRQCLIRTEQPHFPSFLHSRRAGEDYPRAGSPVEPRAEWTRRKGQESGTQ